MRMTPLGKRNLPPLLAVRAFEAAARHLSFSLAARELNVTQSAISRQVRLLEDFLGYSLFVRLTRSVALTSQGTDYLRAAEASLDLLERATSIRSRWSRSTLKVSITQSLGVLLLLPRMESFSLLYPNIDVEVVTSTHPPDFEREGIDAAIRLGPLPGRRYLSQQPRVPHELVRSWRQVSAFHLWDEVLTPVVSRSLLKSRGRPASALDLCKYPLLNVTLRPTAWEDWFRTQGATLPSSSRRLDLGHFFMALDAARAGRGVALIPTLFLGRMDASLVCPVPSAVASAGEYYLLCRDKSAERPAIQAFLQWLQSLTVTARNS